MLGAIAGVSPREKLFCDAPFFEAPHARRVERSGNGIPIPCS
jgi:hypothetical protein